MNGLSFIDFLRALCSTDFSRTSRPGWAGQATRMRKSRRPFSSSRKYEIAPQTMRVEEFTDKDARDARFRELRAARTPHVNKFSTVRFGRSLWCVVRP